MTYYTISTIRRYITTEACETLIHALITSRLDYANFLLYGLPKQQIEIEIDGGACATNSKKLVARRKS